jgi:23S rRNA (uracil1939-C5)-methyltransferase
MDAAEGPLRTPARKPRPGDWLDVEVERPGRGGVRGRAQHASGSYAVELPRGVPGERVRALVLRRRGARVAARAVETLRPSADATAPRCLHFGICGGCGYQNLAYPAQLAAKRRLAEETLGAPVDEVVPCEPPWGYRNKMEFSFGARRFVLPGEPEGAEAGFALGLHPAGMYGRVLDLERCEIAFEGASAIVRTARELARAQGLPPWDVRTHTGLLRHLVLRRGEASGEILANLVTSDDARAAVDRFAAALLGRHPEITTLVQSVNTRPAQVAIGEREHLLRGSGRIGERLHGVRFALSAGSFFQTNTRQAGRLVALALEDCGDGGILHDLYCGAGTFALVLAHRFREAWGFERVASAVADARANAAANGIGHARFVEGDVECSLTAAGAPPADVVVVDPPRAGLHPRVLAELHGSPARRVLYVSCNLASAARDLAVLARGGWRLVRARPVDLFPHTPHLECLLTLERAP